jgi:hypothetical protein
LWPCIARTFRQGDIHYVVVGYQCGENDKENQQQKYQVGHRRHIEFNGDLIPTF